MKYWKLIKEICCKLPSLQSGQQCCAAAAVFVTLVLVAAASPSNSASAQSASRAAAPSEAQSIAHPVGAVMLAEAESIEETLSMPETEAVTEAEEAEEKPSAVKLNMAKVFPEGADSSDVWNSYAGKLYKELILKDSEWLSTVYRYSTDKPETLASKLKLSHGSILGKYRQDEEGHDPDNPSTWTIPKFEKTNYSFTDGSGNTVNAYSNAKDILTLSSVYAFYQKDDSYEAMKTHAQNLWDKSHHVKLSIGKVYYCDGELDEKVDESQEPEETAAPQPVIQETESLEVQLPETQSLAVQPSEAQSTAVQPSEAQSTETQTSEIPSSEVQSTETPSSEVQSTEIPSSEVQSTEIPSSEEQTSETQSSKSLPSESQPSKEKSSEAQSQSKLQIGGAAGGESQAGLSSDSSTDSASTDSNSTQLEKQLTDILGSSKKMITKQTKDSKAKTEQGCTGHVDLNISVSIAGIEGKRGLIASDDIGNSSKTEGWYGWDEYNCVYADYLYKIDWSEIYGLYPSDVAVINPLSTSEITRYLNGLPEGTSPERRDIIEYALTSVGRIPYYWGGKPAAPSYDVNAFGTLVSPDYKGRALKGLDCSGWINWVYWSVTGTKPAAEGTGSLSTYGRPVGKEDLKPGDIMVRLSDTSHVVMFLGWEADGSMKCIHESSRGSGNVIISTTSPNGTAYRNLID